MKSTIFVLLSIAILLPRSSSAAAIRSVDNSDYGMQLGDSCTAAVSNTSASSPLCTYTSFLGSTFRWGFMVWFESPVSDIEVKFSNATILETGLDVCTSTEFSEGTCSRPSTPTLDLFKHPGALSLFSMPFAPTLGVPGSSAIFDLNGSFAAGTDNGDKVAFLLLCSEDDGSNPLFGAGKPADRGCADVSISVSSLASTVPTPVPEPASLLLCGSGATMLARRLRKRQAR